MHQNRRRPACTTPRSGSRFVSLLVMLSLLAAALPFAAPAAPATAAAALIKLPFAPGASWTVLQGYNTAPADSSGGSHYNCDPKTLKDSPTQTERCGAEYQYRYSLDLVRADGSTSGQPIYSPVNGTVTWRDDSTGGLSISMGGNYAFAFFHVNLDSRITAGTAITQGQYLGTIAPGGQANNGGTPHIHVTLWQTTDNGNWSRYAVPFTGSYALDGRDLSDKGPSAKNQYVGSTVVSTNTPSQAVQTPAANAVPDAPSLTSPSNGTTYQSTGLTVTFTWKAVTGATKYQLQLDGVATDWLTTTSWTSGPLTDTGQYSWKVRAMNASGIGNWSGAIVFWIDPANGAGCSAAGAPSSGSLSLVTDASSGVVTDCVMLTGKGFKAGESVNIYFDTPSGAPFSTAAAGTNGSFYDAVIIPDIAGGAHTFYAKGASSARQATAGFRVSPTIRRDPFSGAVGDSVLITGRGFGAGERVNLTFISEGSAPDVSLGSFTVDARGTGTLSTRFPSGTSGLHDYKGVGAATGLTAWGAMQIVRTVTAAPASGKPGASIAISASGFPGSAAVTARWTSFSGAVLCSGTTSAVGNFNCSVTIPSNALAGSYPVFVATGGGTGTSALVSVSGSPAVSVSTSSGRAGSKITIAGGGFKPGGSVTLTWSGADWVTIHANSGGSFSYPTTVPPGFIGDHTLGARGTSSSGATIMPTTVFHTSSTGGDTGSRMTSYGSFAVTATIEGLVGETTSNGHRITPFDHFVSLPSCTGTSCPTWSTGPASACGSACYVRVTNPATNKCSVAPVYDVGPWFTNDNWWDPAADRKLNGLSANPTYLVQGYPAAEANLDGFDVGYGQGISNVGYTTGNRAAIDVADGTWVDIGLNQNAGIAPVVVSMLWLTGENYQTAMRGCGQTAGIPSIKADSSTKIGRPITATGSGFRSGEAVSIRWGSATAPIVATATANSSGAFTVSATLTPATNGPHYLYATAASGKPWTKVSIVQNIAFSSTSGGSYSKITVTATGFAANEVVSFNWGTSAAAASVTTDSKGSATFLVRTRYGNGTATGTLTGKTSGLKATASYTVIQSLALSPDNGSPGQKITVSGKGWDGSASVTVYFNRTATSNGSTFCTARTNTGGAFSCSGTIPAGIARGVYPIAAASRALTSSAQLTVNGISTGSVPTAQLDATSGSSYSIVTVNVANFPPNEMVKLNWDSAIWGANPSSVGGAVTDAQGAASFPVRTRNGYGLWTGTATGQTSGRKATVTYTVNPSVTLSASTGPAESNLTINGNGWPAAQPGSVAVVPAGASSGTSLCTMTTTTVGRFSCTATMPANLKAGTYSIVATMGVVTAASPFTITTVAAKAVQTAPAVNAGASPAAGDDTATPVSEQPSASITPEPSTPTPVTETPTNTATPEPSETPTPEPTVAPGPETTVLGPIAAMSASYPSEDTGTPVAAIDPSVELLAGGPGDGVAAISFDIELIGDGAVVSATLVLTGGPDGAGYSTAVTALPGYIVDPAVTDPASLPLNNAAPAQSAGEVAAQFASSPGIENALDVTGSISSDGVVTFFITGPADQVLAIEGIGSGAPPRLELVVQSAG